MLLLPQPDFSEDNLMSMAIETLRRLEQRKKYAQATNNSKLEEDCDAVAAEIHGWFHQRKDAMTDEQLWNLLRAERNLPSEWPEL